MGAVPHSCGATSANRSSAASAAWITSARRGCSNGGWNRELSNSRSGSWRRWRSLATTRCGDRPMRSRTRSLTSREHERLVEVLLAARSALQLARRGLRQRARRDQHHVAWRDAAHLERAVVDLAADRLELRPVVVVAGDAHLGHHHHALLALVALDADRDDVAGAYPVDSADGALDVLREHVAATDDDHVLDPPAQHQLAVEQVGEVAGAQPVVVEQRGGGVGTLVVAGRHRGPADQQLADVALGRGSNVSGSTIRISRPGSGRPSSGRRRAVRARSSGSSMSTGLAT